MLCETRSFSPHIGVTDQVTKHIQQDFLYLERMMYPRDGELPERCCEHKQTNLY